MESNDFTTRVRKWHMCAFSLFVCLCFAASNIAIAYVFIFEAKGNISLLYSIMEYRSNDIFKVIFFYVVGLIISIRSVMIVADWDAFVNRYTITRDLMFNDKVLIHGSNDANTFFRAHFILCSIAVIFNSILIYNII